MLPFSGFLTVFRILPRESFMGLKGTRERDRRGEGHDAIPQVGPFGKAAWSGAALASQQHSHAVFTPICGWASEGQFCRAEVKGSPQADLELPSQV